MTITPPNPNSVVWPDVDIFLSYFKFYPATLISLIGFNYQPFKTDTDNSYTDFFRQRWNEEKKFILVEQDVVVWPGAIQAIWDCPREWCAYDFHLPNHQTRNLEEEKNGVPIGCVKISPEMISKTPNMWKEDVKWDVCDLNLTRKAIEAGVQVHQHHPGVVNANSVFLDYLGGVN